MLRSVRFGRSSVAVKRLVSASNDDVSQLWPLRFLVGVRAMGMQ